MAHIHLTLPAGGVSATLVVKGRPRAARITQDALNLTALYKELAERMKRVKSDLIASASTHDEKGAGNPYHEPAGSGKGGQFTTGPKGEKPTTVKATSGKAAVHELLSSGHPFTKKELADIVGIKPELVSDLDHFKTTPVYHAAVEAGLIHDDKWVGDYATKADDKAIKTNDRRKGGIVIHFK